MQQCSTAGARRRWQAAAKQHGIDPKVAALAFADGAMAMIAAWIGAVDAAMDAAFAGNALVNTPIRERIRRLVTFRLDALATREEALRRALAIMAMPQNAAASLRLGWASADSDVAPRRRHIDRLQPL